MQDHARPGGFMRAGGRFGNGAGRLRIGIMNDMSGVTAARARTR
jgi:hypothetical protein